MTSVELRNLAVWPLLASAALSACAPTSAVVVTGPAILVKPQPSPSDAPDFKDCLGWRVVTEGSLSDRITDPMVAIHHDQGTSPHFRATRIAYELDGLLLFAQRLDRTRPPEPNLPIFEGRIRPGRHTLTVYLMLAQLAHERLTEEPEGHLTLRTSQTFLIGDGQLASIVSRTRELDEGRSATVELDTNFRAARSD